jgi:putative flippase GtrA
MSSYFTLEILFKFLRFGVVGLSGMVVDFGVTYLLRDKLKVHQYLANAVGFVMAATSNYVLNRIWTFKSSNPEVLLEFGEFFIVSAIGLGINSLILWFLVSRWKKHFYLSKLIAIGVTMIWNFFANLLITFS